MADIQLTNTLYYIALAYFGISVHELPRIRSVNSHANDVGHDILFNDIKDYIVVILNNKTLGLNPIDG